MKLLMPKVRSLREVFASCRQVHISTGYESRAVKTWDTVPGPANGCPGKAHLMSFVSIRGGRRKSGPIGLDVTFHPEVVELVEKNMMLCDRYRINFGLVVQSGGSVLVTANYDLICGGRWFAKVPESCLDGRRLHFGLGAGKLGAPQKAAR